MNNLRSIATESLGWLIATGILLVLAGAFAIYSPLAAGLAADTTLSVLIIVGGIAHFVLAWKLRHIGGSLWEILIGTTYLAAGIFLLVFPISGLVTLTAILAVYLFSSAVTELLSYYTLRFLPGSGWLLANGIITFILAIMIVAHLPTSAAWVPGTLVGFAMLSSGVSRLMLAYAAKQAVTALHA